jgi:hypothetical protein
MPTKHSSGGTSSEASMTLVEYLSTAYDAEVDLVLGDSSVIETEEEAPKPVDMTEFAELLSDSDIQRKPKK